jgi:hypothetical protein
MAHRGAKVHFENHTELEGIWKADSWSNFRYYPSQFSRRAEENHPRKSLGQDSRDLKPVVPGYEAGVPIIEL